MVKKVASAAGVERYGLPKGTPLDGSHLAEKTAHAAVEKTAQGKVTADNPYGKKQLHGSFEPKKKRTAQPYLKSAKARLTAANNVDEKKKTAPSAAPKPAEPSAAKASEGKSVKGRAADMLATPEQKAATAHKHKWMVEYGLDAQEYVELVKMEKEMASAKDVDADIDAPSPSAPTTTDLSGTPLTPQAQNYLDGVADMLMDKTMGSSFLDEMTNLYKAMPGFGTQNDKGKRVTELPEGVDAKAMRGVFKTALMQRGLTDIEAEKLLYAPVTMPGHMSEESAREDLAASEKTAYLKSITDFLDEQSATSIQGMVNTLRDREFGAQQGVTADEFRALYTQKLIEKGMTKETAEKFIETGEIPDTDPDSPLGQKARRVFPLTPGNEKYPLVKHDDMTQKWADTQRSLVTDDPDAANAVVRYIGSAYDPINKALRSKEIPWEDGMSAEYIKKMDRALVKQETDTPTTVFRLFKTDAASGFDPGKLKDGSFYTDNGYVSTTVNPEQFTNVGSLVNYDYDNAYTMEIRVPAGNRALYGTGLPQRVQPDNLDPKDPPILPGEEELILDRGTTYRVIKNDPYQRHIVVEVFTQRVVDNDGQTVTDDQW